MSRALASSAAPRPARPVSRRAPRAARSLPRASALRVTPPAASSPDETRRGSAAWGDAWGSVADPNTRVAYVDDAERDLSKPIISFSLGSPCVFLLGGDTRDAKPTPLILRSGDAVARAM